MIHIYDQLMNVEILFDETMFPSQQLFKVKKFLYDIAEKCPSKARLVAHFEKPNRMKLLIRTLDGSWKIFGKGEDMEKMFEMIASYLERKLYNWRKNRFLNLNQDNNANYKVLIIEDDEVCAKFLDTFLQQYHCQTKVAMEEEVAIAELANNQHNLIILDWKLPHMSGGDVIKTADQMVMHSSNNVELPLNARTPVVTFSGLNKKEILFPPTSYFSHMGHIQKLESSSNIKNSILSMLLGAIRHEKLQFA